MDEVATRSMLRVSLAQRLASAELDPAEVFEAVTRIAMSVPRKDVWKSAPSFMEYVAAELDRVRFPRPDSYPDDW